MLDIRRYSTVSKAIFLLLCLFLLASVCYTSIMWSFAQTRDFANSSFPKETNNNLFLSLPFWLSIFIQFSPQAFFALSANEKNKNTSLFYLCIALAMTGIDMFTNIGQQAIDTRNITGYTGSALVLRKFFAYGLSIIIVFAEEIAAKFVSLTVETIAMLWEDFGGTAPTWLLSVSSLASDASGMSSSRRNESNNRGNSRRNS